MRRRIVGHDPYPTFDLLDERTLRITIHVSDHPGNIDALSRIKDESQDGDYSGLLIYLRNIAGHRRYKVRDIRYRACKVCRERTTEISELRESAERLKATWSRERPYGSKYGYCETVSWIERLMVRGLIEFAIMAISGVIILDRILDRMYRQYIEH